MKPSEIIKLLADSLINELKRREATDKQIIRTINGLKDVLRDRRTLREDIKHIVCNMMLTNRESIPMKRNNRIQFEMLRGFNLKFDLETELEILNFVDGKEFNQGGFTSCFTRLLEEKLKEIKK